MVFLDDFAETGDGLAAEAGIMAALEDAGHLGSGGGGDGDEDLVDGVARGNRGEVRAGAEDGDELDAHAPLEMVIVDEPADVIGEARVGADFAQKYGTCVPGSVDEDALASSGLVPGGKLAQHAREEADAGRGIGAKQKVQQVYGAGESRRCDQEENKGGDGGCRDISEADANEVRDGGVAPPATIEKEQAEHDGLDHDPNGDGDGHLGEVGGFEDELEADEKGEDAAQSKDGELNKPDEDARRTREMESAREVLEEAGEHGVISLNRHRRGTEDAESAQRTLRKTTRA